MGYAARPTYVLLKLCTEGHVGQDLTTANMNYSLGNVTTPAYRGTPSLVFVDVVIPCRVETSGAGSNYLRDVNGGYVALNDGVSTLNCGYYMNGDLWINSGETTYSEYRLRGRTSIHAGIKPSTLYTCTLVSATVARDTLYLRRPQFEIHFYFNI